MKTVAIVQARMGSTRFPNKVMQPICGIPMIGLLLERLAKAKRIDQIVLATSEDQRNEPLATYVRELGYAVYQGSEDDVLDRYCQAAKDSKADTVVRITGDCPLIDPAIVDAVIAIFFDFGVDYASNVSPPTYPDGLDVEVMRFPCLMEAHREATLPSEREHVTTFLRTHPERFRQRNYAAEVDRSGLRWTVDEEQDLEFVQSVYRCLYMENPDFLTDDILGLLADNPQLQLLNSRFERNEGFRKSLQDDARFLARGE